MSVTRKIKHKSADGVIAEYDIGVLSQNVAMASGNTLDMDIVGKAEKVTPTFSDGIKIEDSTAPYHNTRISQFGAIRRTDLSGNELAIYPDMNTKKWMLEVAEAASPERRGAIYSEINKPNKADVGLSSVDNTSDAAKPVSSATQAALNTKANTASPVFADAIKVQKNAGMVNEVVISPNSGNGFSVKATHPMNGWAELYVGVGNLLHRFDTGSGKMNSASVYTQLNMPPSDAAAVQLDAYNNNKIDMLISKKAIFLNSSPQSISIINAKAGDEGTVFAKPGSEPLILPSNSKKSTNFVDDSAGGPLLYRFFYDGTTFWWSCDKYNA